MILQTIYSCIYVVKELIYVLFLYLQKEFIPVLLRATAPNRRWPMQSPKLHVLQQRPKQFNNYDCGIFVAKYVDCILQDIDITKLPNWTEDELNIFRVRIAHEIRQFKARSFLN